MSDYKIQQAFKFSYHNYCQKAGFQSEVQKKTALAVLNCKSGSLGYNTCVCEDCGHTEIHNNSCRNRNCPNCQAVKKEIWVDKRRSEVIDSPYFHVVFTLPHELNPLIYCNQKLLYGLFHRCCAETLLELSLNKKYLGATPGIIQVLHTWNQELLYHVHMHCIVSGGGLTHDRKLCISGKNFFIPVFVLRDKFQGKFLALLEQVYQSGQLTFSSACASLQNESDWKIFKNELYKKEWCPYIKKTFNGFGNAIEYLGKYTHRIAISNHRLIRMDENTVSYYVKDYREKGRWKEHTVSGVEFIRRFLMHVPPKRFVRIRHYGLLCTRSKNKHLTLCRNLLGCKQYLSRLKNMEAPQILETLYGIRITVCKCCGGHLGKPQQRIPLRI